jgi:signal transduction histidine kinase/putative methionine-R-sulfoxide reductase with GAF domain
LTLRLDADFWSARMAYLAKLAQADAIAIVLNLKSEGYVTYVAHNVPSDTRWADVPQAALLARALTSRTAEQAAGCSIPLGDGRTADAVAIVPVVWKEQLVGALAALLVGRVFTPDETAGLIRVAELVGLELAEANALSRAQQHQQDSETSLRGVRALQAIIRRERDPSQLLERATTQLAEIFGADGVSIMLADAEGELSVRAAHGLSEEAKRDRKRIGEGISGKVAQTGQAVLLTGQVPGGSDPTVSESMIAPMRTGGKTIGVVNVKHRSPQGRYGQAHVESLSQVASDIGAALLMAEELRRAEDDRRQALVLYELSRLATLGSDPQNDLESAAAMLADNLRHDAIGIWAAEEHKLKLKASFGYGPIIPPDIPTSSGSDTVLARVLRERRTATAIYGAGDGRPDWAAPSATSFLLAPIGGAHSGVVLGVLVLGRMAGSYGGGDGNFAATLAEYLAGMLQKHASTDVVQRTAASERRRIAQELHDGLAQELTGVVLALEGCQRALDRDPSLLAPQLAKAARDARATLSDVRQYMAALRQTEESGGLNLPVTVARLVDDLRRQSGLHVDLEETGVERELEPFVERAVIRIVGESLRNVAQHSGASNAKVVLRYDAEQVVATIEDDGKGFDSQELGTAEERGHYGIVGMRERAEGVGGQLVVRSEAGRGTIVRASIPYRAAAEQTTPGWNQTIEDPDQQGVIEDVERTEKAGFLGRLFGR